MKTKTQKTDIEVTNHGTIFTFRPLTAAGRRWLAEYCPAGDDRSYLGEALAVEPRYAWDLAEGMIEDGLRLV